ncbi:hypothetical protein ACFLT9_08555, partial [Acidobacteriota bacterium]
YAILHDSPTPVSLLRSDIPSHLENIIEKALAKKLKERYPDIGELIRDLKKSQSVALPKAEKSIVVLPFENLSPDPDQEYFCDGMTEEITSDLSKIHDLLVISRNSAMTFKGTKKKTKEIGKELNVHYVLEGSVRKAGNNLRITAQLIDAKTDTHIWTDKYSGVLDDIFDIQESVSRSIAEQLKIKLSPQDISNIKEGSLENVKAYDCYLRARFELTKYTSASFDRARDFLQKSLNIIGENALLYAMLGQAFYWYHDFGFAIDLDPLQEAEKYAKKASELNPDLAPIHFLLGLLERGKGNLKKAVRYINQAVQIDSNDPYMLSMFIWTNSAYVGRSKDMRSYAVKLMEIDPVSPINYFTISMMYLAEGQWNKGTELMRKCIELDPGFRWVNLWLAHIYARIQDNSKFYEVVDHLLEEDSEDIIAQWILFLRNIYEKNWRNALKALNKDLEDFCWKDPEGVWLMAGCFATIGERDHALKWMEHAFERGWINYPLFARIDPFLENIRGEPRFKKLMERVKHEWENFEV